jgi:hypothetical protein
MASLILAVRSAVRLATTECGVIAICNRRAASGMFAGKPGSLRNLGGSFRPGITTRQTRPPDCGRHNQP